MAGLVQGKRHDFGISSTNCLQRFLDCSQVLLGITLEHTLLDVIKESVLHIGMDEFDPSAWLYLVEHIQKEVHLISHKIRASPEMSLMQKVTSHLRGNLNLKVSPLFVRVVLKCSGDVRTISQQVSKVRSDPMMPLITDSSKSFRTFYFASFYKPERRDSAASQGLGLCPWTILPRHPRTGVCLGSLQI